MDGQQVSVLEWKRDWEEEDSYLEETKKTTKDTRTLDLICQEADKLMLGLVFMVDSPQNNKDDKYPMMDLKVWAKTSEDDVITIRHMFFEKDIASPLVFHSRGVSTCR